jgi:hypothetical protein
MRNQISKAVRRHLPCVPVSRRRPTPRLCFLLALAVCTQAAIAGEPRRDAYGDALPEHVIARLGTVRFRHSAPVLELFFFPDGKNLLSCDIAGGVHVWRLATAERLGMWHFPGCLQFAAAPDGKTLVGAADDGALLLIDTATGAIRSRLRGHATQVGAMAISRDSKWLASATWDLFKDDNDAPHEKNLCLWNLHSGERVRTFELPDRLTSVLAFDDTGKRLFTAGGSQGFIKQRAACGLRRARGSGVA